MRFYPGLSLQDVWSMKAEDEEMLWKAITVIESQETLLGLTVSSFPQMEKSKQETLHRKLHREAYPETYERPVEITGEHLAAIING